LVLVLVAVAREHPQVTIGEQDLLTTAEAARLLRSSRAQVADLCLRGLLPYVKVGVQRRLRRADVEALIEPALTREQMESLWLHRAVAGKVVVNPPAMIAAATINLRRLRRLHPAGPARDGLSRWSAVLDDGVEAVLDALTSSAPYAIELRNTSPFGGILTEAERRTVLAAFGENRRDRARSMRAEKLEQVLRTV
jgi:excisionase family DNA binding protein